MATKTRRKFDRKTAQKEALNRATTNASLANYGVIIEGFAARGIHDVRPRETVLTFSAWKAIGRYVRKGEKGVTGVCTWIDCEKEKKDGTKDKFKMPKATAVFHYSQTDPSKYATDAEKAHYEQLTGQPFDGERVEMVVDSSPVIAGYLTYAA